MRSSQDEISGLRIHIEAIYHPGTGSLLWLQRTRNRYYLLHAQPRTMVAKAADTNIQRTRQTHLDRRRLQKIGLLAPSHSRLKRSEDTETCSYPVPVQLDC